MTPPELFWNDTIFSLAEDIVTLMECKSPTAAASLAATQLAVAMLEMPEHPEGLRKAAKA
ncbi:MAG TPA: hypothetical protein VNX88_12895 [Terriglobales bacterium]|jgi:hypothetical protein|nr:hypothetical protein [Terriglobales bacterium]